LPRGSLAAARASGRHSDNLPNQMRGAEMNQFYYDNVTKMEQMAVDDEYIQGWQCGFLQNPKREEQRLTDAYEAGYADGEGKNTENFGNWVKP
jgi:hypothetical protein